MGASASVKYTETKNKIFISVEVKCLTTSDAAHKLLSIFPVLFNDDVEEED